MVRIKPVIRVTRKSKTGLYPVEVRVTYHYVARFFGTGVLIPKEHWDETGLMVAPQDPKSDAYNKRIFAKRRELETIVERLEGAGGFTWELMDRELGRDKNLPKKKLFVFIESVVKDMKAKDKIGNYLVYQNVLESLKKYLNKRDVRLSSVNVNFVRDYWTWLEKKGLKGNTISVYLRTLRSILNKAIEAKLMNPGSSPFGHKPKVELEGLVDRGRPIALTHTQMHQVIDMDLKPGSAKARSRDIFAFSYYAHGMNFKDIALLKKENLIAGYIVYTRAKTRGKGVNRISILITPELQAIMDRYVVDDSDYIFPILRGKDSTAMEISDAIRFGRRNMNADLREIGNELKIPFNLIYYSARHTYAMVLFEDAKAPMPVIQRALNHKRITTTEVYLKSLKDSAVEDLNKYL